MEDLATKLLRIVIRSKEFESEGLKLESITLGADNFNRVKDSPLLHDNRYESDSILFYDYRIENVRVYIDYFNPDTIAFRFEERGTL